MIEINIRQARKLLEMNEPIYLAVGNEVQEITKNNLLTNDSKGNDKYYPFDRPTIKILIQQTMGIDTMKWKYLANIKKEKNE